MRIPAEHQQPRLHSLDAIRAAALLGICLHACLSFVGTADRAMLAELHWTIKFLLINALSCVLLLITYHYWVRSTWIGRLLNGTRQRLLE